MVPSRLVPQRAQGGRESCSLSFPGAVQPRIPQLDGLRGIAILSVVLFHCLLFIPLPHDPFRLRLQNCVRLGAYGVDLFFVLSGFLIGGILLDSKDSPRYFRTFYIRRFHRIFPLYYLWLALYVVAGLSVFAHLPESIRAAWPGWRPVWVYALFLQNLVPKYLPGISAAWLGPLWSLAVEEQFYLVMPLAVHFLSKRRLVQALTATVFVSPLLRLALFPWMTAHAAQWSATPLRADGLAMGVLLAIALRDAESRAQLERSMRWLCAAIGVLLAFVVYSATRPESKTEVVWGFSGMSLLFAGLLLVAVLRPQGWWSQICRLSMLRNVGGISYCLYVIHLAVITIAASYFPYLSAWFPGHASQPLLLGAIGVLPTGLVLWILAKLSWRYLESPMVRRGHAYKY